MHLCFLKTPDIEIPQTVKVLENYGEESVFGIDTGSVVATGEVGNGMSGFRKEKIKNAF